MGYDEYSNYYKKAYEFALAELRESGMAGPSLVRKVEAQLEKLKKEAIEDE